jgi:hypothetical protein
MGFVEVAGSNDLNKSIFSYQTDANKLELEEN